MKAAIVASARGHNVTLLEQNGQLGGQALWAQRLPGRSEFGGIVTNLAGELGRSDVKVCLNETASTARIAQLDPDAVVLATGAYPHIPDGDFDEAHCVQAWDVIAGRAKPGAHAVVADWRCDWVGPGVAELLARAGHKVTLAVNGEMPGQNIQKYVRYQLAGRLHGLGVDVVPYMRVFGADKDCAYLQHVVTGAPHMIEAVDTIVLAWGSDADTTLEDHLRRELPDLPVHLIGDCASPRTAEEAVLEGLKIGATL
jgi:NADPH-dependent 2,4-dienoyl-CoA reductase/sulfur reductase-like enzyme